MKNIITFITSALLIFVLTVPFCSISAYADENEDSAIYTFTDSETVTDILTAFVTANSSRSGGTDGESAAAEWLYNSINALGYQTDYQEFEFYDYENIKRTSKNVVAVKDNASTDKQVIIGAHYDNVSGMIYDGTTYGGDGAGDNGSGVATLIKTAYNLKDAHLDFDLIFVLFGAEEYGLHGSLSYLESMSDTELKNTLLVINFDCVGVGDYLYMYDDEVQTLHGKFFREVANDNEVLIANTPSNKNIIFGSSFDGFNVLPYTHIGLMSDNAVFFNAGLNTLNFLGYNWTDRSNPEGVESSEHINIINSSDDTLENYLEFYGESGEEKMQTVVKLVSTALQSEGFIAATENSKQEKFDYSFISKGTVKIIIYALLLVVIGAFGYLWYKKLNNIQKKSVKSEVESSILKKESEKVFEDF